MRKIKEISLCLALVSVLSTMLIPWNNAFAVNTNALFVWSSSVETAAEAHENTTETIEVAETAESTNQNSLNLESTSAILMDQKSGNILYEHNIHEQLRPASVTKVMTMLLIMEAIESGQISLEDPVPVSETARSMGGSQIWLNENETLSVHEMLKAITVVSANDASVAMAEFISGTEGTFVEKMNSRARDLGMNNTVFKNSHGIDEDGHLTTAYDIAIMSRELMESHPTIAEYSTIWMDSLRGGASELVNTNKLVRTYDGITGLKTGSTSISLFNLSATATRSDLSLIAVIMRAETSVVRFNEVRKLLDYGFANFEYSTFSTAGELVRTIDVEKGISTTVDVVFEIDNGTLVEKGTGGNISSSVELSELASAPITQGQVLGVAIYTMDNVEVRKNQSSCRFRCKKTYFP